MERTVVRYAVRPGNTIRNWYVWEVVRECKDGGSREAWGQQVETVRTKKLAKERVAQLNLELNQNLNLRYGIRI